MQQEYREALQGTLCSSAKKTEAVEFLFFNSTPLHLTIWWVDAHGGLYPTPYMLEPFCEGSGAELSPNQYYVFRALDSSFVTVILLESASREINITQKNVTKSNAIGAILPTSDNDTYIPPDSPSVCAIVSAIKEELVSS